MEERWLPIAGYEGIYEVSDAGRVRSLDRWYGPKLNKFRKGRLKTANLSTRGYPAVDLAKKWTRRTATVHSLVLTAFVGPRPHPDAVTRHLNGIKTDNRLANLAWGTAAENYADNQRLGVMPRGEECPMAKLTDAAVIAIRASSERNATLARRYGVDFKTLKEARIGKTWRHVGGAR